MKLSQAALDSETTSVAHADLYLQKPSIKVMMELDMVDRHGKAMIDTGVVVATGKAFNSLLSFSSHEIISQSTNNPRTSVVSDLRLELYSDILHCLALTTGRCTFVEYLQRLGSSTQSTSDELEQLYSHSSSIYDQAIFSLWKDLRDLPLFVVAVFDGLFYHLGTSKEYLDFVTADPSSSSTKLAMLASKYELENRIYSFIEDGDKSFTSLCSVVFECGDIDEGSLIEFSYLSERTRIGSRSIVSCVDRRIGEDLTVKSGILLQQVRLRSTSSSSRWKHPFTIIVLGLDDDIKAPYSDRQSTICGVSWSTFLDVSFLPL